MYKEYTADDEMPDCGSCDHAERVHFGGGKRDDQGGYVPPDFGDMLGIDGGQLSDG